MVIYLNNNRQKYYIHLQNIQQHKYNIYNIHNNIMYILHSHNYNSSQEPALDSRRPRRVLPRAYWGEAVLPSV